MEQLRTGIDLAFHFNWPGHVGEFQPIGISLAIARPFFFFFNFNLISSFVFVLQQRPLQMFISLIFFALGVGVGGVDQMN